jgi:putative peptidoglycan lipid II flippase
VSSRGRSVLSVNGLVVAALAIGFASNILIAALFGLTRRVDAYFAAAMLPNLFMVLCIDYLGKNFLPVFAAAKRESDASASALASSILTIVGLFAAALATILALCSEPLFSVLLPGFDDAETALVSRYFLILAPCMVFMALNRFQEYVCQYDEMFIPIALMRTALPIANLLSIVLLAPALDEYCLAVGQLVGHVTVFALMSRYARFRYRPSLSIRPHFERKVFANSAVVMSTGMIARTRSIVANYLASSMGPGAIAALAFAAKLTEPLQRSAFSGVKMVMFSRTVRLLGEKDDRAIGRLYMLGLRLSFMVMLPLLWWIALNSNAIVDALYAHGKFNAEMSALVAAIVVAFLPSVLLLGVNQILSNAFYAMDRVAVPATVMPSGALVYAMFAIPLAAAIGPPGLAFATTMMSMVLFGALLTILGRFMPFLEPLTVVAHLLGYAAASGATVVAVTWLLDRGAGLSAPLVMLGSLPLGSMLYFGLLAVIRDRAWRWFFDLARDGLRLRAAAA